MQETWLSGCCHINQSQQYGCDGSLRKAACRYHGQGRHALSTAPWRDRGRQWRGRPHQKCRRHRCTALGRHWRYHQGVVERAARKRDSCGTKAARLRDVARWRPSHRRPHFAGFRLPQSPTEGDDCREKHRRQPHSDCHFRIQRQDRCHGAPARLYLLRRQSAQALQPAAKPLHRRCRGLEAGTRHISMLFLPHAFTDIGLQGRAEISVPALQCTGRRSRGMPSPASRSGGHSPEPAQEPCG